MPYACTYFFNVVLQRIKVKQKKKKNTPRNINTVPTF